jgi:two-component system, sensor histidine kinase and response regulator
MTEDEEHESKDAVLYDCIARVMGTPATPAPRTSGIPHNPVESQPLLQAHVLVAEDNMVNQKVAVRVRDKLGCCMDVAVNWREAVDCILQRRH